MSRTPSPITRSSEPKILLWSLYDPIWVRCPRCNGPARVNSPKNRWRSNGEVPTLSCAKCGLSRRDALVFVAGRTRLARVTRRSPRCDRCGRALTHASRKASMRHGTIFSVASTCAGCGHVSYLPASPRRHDLRDGYDPYFGLPLFLSQSVGAELVWAWNARHLDLLGDWLGATLRERSIWPYHWSMMSRLPRWMKLAGNRSKVLHALTKLRDQAVLEELA